jgi:hypothetical protein
MSGNLKTSCLNALLRSLRDVVDVLEQGACQPSLRWFGGVQRAAAISQSVNLKFQFYLGRWEQWTWRLESSVEQ